MSDFSGLSNYPPGVSGQEYEIAGADYEILLTEPCRECGAAEVYESGYQGTAWTNCENCGHHVDDVADDSREPDDIFP